jgi:D-3-phosphoglycerate dehydrogenase / 2-oxoglutarate reductase
MKILIASPIDESAITRLAADHEVRRAGDGAELAELMRDGEVLVFRSGVSITAELLQAAVRLRLIIRAGSGTDNIDLAAVQSRGIHFERIPEPGAKAVAEMSFALMLALARNLLGADHSWRAGRWLKHELAGVGLSGKVLGVYGAGAIGSRVGALGAAWGMEVLGCVEHPSLVSRDRLAALGIQLVDGDEVLARADFLSIHVPLTTRTRNLFDRSALAQMQPGGFLVNLARGGVVDEQALRDALLSGHLRGTALDVHEHEGEGTVSPLADLPNVILTPHIGASTVDAQAEIGQRVVDVVEKFAVDDGGTGAVTATTVRDSSGRRD